MDSPHQSELAVALDAVRLAARVCRSVQAGIAPDALEKRDRSPVTVADFASQAVICRALQRHFPDDPVVAEEDASALRQPDQRPFLDRVRAELAQAAVEGNDDDLFGWIDHGGHPGDAERFWTLDPIDGTKGFLRNEQYAVSLALLVRGRIELALLACPNLPLTEDAGAPAGCVMAAVRGEGSRVWPLDDPRAPPLPVHVSPTTGGGFARFCESVEAAHSSHDDAARVADVLGIAADPVRLDSQAKYAVVARGEADIYLRLPTRQDYHEKIWDHAGGVLIVEEAGGRVSDIAGRPLEFTRGRELIHNRGVVVTNGHLHDQVLDALHALHVG